MSPWKQKYSGGFSAPPKSSQNLLHPPFSLESCQKFPEDNCICSQDTIHQLMFIVQFADESKEVDVYVNKLNFTSLHHPTNHWNNLKYSTNHCVVQTVTLVSRWYLNVAPAPSHKPLACCGPKKKGANFNGRAGSARPISGTWFILRNLRYTLKK